MRYFVITAIYINIVMHLKSYDEQNRENCVHNNIIPTYIHPSCMYIPCRANTARPEVKIIFSRPRNRF